MEPLLDAKGVAAYLNIHRTTLYRIVADGRIEEFGFRIIRIKSHMRFERMGLWRNDRGELRLREEFVYQVDFG